MTADRADTTSLLRGACSEAITVAEELSLVCPYGVNDTSISKIPQDQGIYLWSSSATGEVVYVGVALGKKGLRQRIASQHLRPSYCKSVFRIKIAADLGIGLGNESVEVIRKGYLLSYLACPELEPATLKIAELLLIAVHQPKYNSRSPVG